MSICFRCGVMLENDDNLCAYHVKSEDTDWHIANKIMCDYFHRKIEPKRLNEKERVDESYWVSHTQTTEVGNSGDFDG